jgi:CubicO group peptidase (beta-lactamase class C family)
MLHKSTSSSNKLTRRSFFGTTALGLAAFSLNDIAQGKTIEATQPKLAAFDDLMERFLQEHQPPGVALAVSYHGRLVYARGFGRADVEKQLPVEPTSLFRIASISKTFTSAAILRLQQQYKLSLEDKVFDILKFTAYLEGNKHTDSRLRDVRIRHCLQHTGGWDRSKSIDPMSASTAELIAKKLKISLPIQSEHIIRFMLDQPLDSSPGTTYAYSNFGYCLLGRVIEACSSRTYSQFVEQEILAPIGIHQMRLGKNLYEDRAPCEVKYYDGNKNTARAISGPEIGKRVPLPYGVECLETMDANGGWIASAVDLVRFAVALEDPKNSKILDEKAIQTMLAPPEGTVGHTADGKPKHQYYACGWNVRPDRRIAGKCTKWHDGMLAGTSTLLMCRDDRINWAVLFNSDADAHGKQFAGMIQAKLQQAVGEIKEWPSEDLFEKYLH